MLPKISRGGLIFYAPPCIYMRYIHARTYCARYIHAPTHPNICTLCTLHTCTHLHNMRILCTIHACTNPPLHSDVVHDTYMHQPNQTRVYCARYIHAPTHPNICTLCTLHTCTHLFNTYTACIKG